MNSSTDVTQEPSYSKAFERFVHDPGDVVGLLAYALFKAAVREEAQQGTKPNSAVRAPVPATIGVYRLAAEQKIAEIISDGITQATPDIKESAMIDAVRTAQNTSAGEIKSGIADIKSHFDNRTSFKQAMLTSFAGWLLTLGATAIIIFLAGRASVEDMVKSAVASSNPRTTSGK